jgi:thioesterase domain-containing protein
MTRQLRQTGAEVALLAILDTAAPHALSERYWQDWDDTQWLLAIAHEIETFLGTRLDITREELEPLNSDARLTRIVDKLRSKGSWFAGAETDSLRGYLSVYKSNFRAVYEPPADVLVDRIVLLKTSESRPEDYAPSPETAALRQDPAWGWERFSSRQVEIIDVPGDHLTMLLEPHVSALAASLDRCLEETRNV